MNAASQSRDELLQRLLAGDLDPASEEARGLLEQDPELQNRLQELQEVGDLLDETAEAERAVLTDLSEPPGSAEQVARALARAWRSDGSSGGGIFGLRPRLLLGLVAAAAVIVAVSVFLRRGNESAPPPPVRLGGEVECLEPRGEVSDYRAFRWRAERPPGARCELRVVDSETGREVLEILRLEGNEWTPNEEQRATLPERIRWSVELSIAGSPDPVLSGHAEAWRAPQ